MFLCVSGTDIVAKDDVGLAELLGGLKLFTVDLKRLHHRCWGKVGCKGEWQYKDCSKLCAEEA